VLIFVLARYRLVLVACLMPFAAWLILRGVSWARERDVRPLALALACVLVVFAVGSVRFADLPHGLGFADQWAFVAQTYAREGKLEQAAEAYESALREDWIDSRRAQAERWKVWTLLVETQIALGRITQARGSLAELSSEVRTFRLGPEHPIVERIRELQERTSMLR
jgi:hypothetical protein